MSDLTPEFEAAVTASKTLTAPDQQAMLRLYALYKQSTSGDVDTKRPGFTDPVGRAKWDARNAIKGQSSADAQAEYVSLVDSLK